MENEGKWFFVQNFNFAVKNQPTFSSILKITKQKMKDRQEGSQEAFLWRHSVPWNPKVLFNLQNLVADGDQGPLFLRWQASQPTDWFKTSQRSLFCSTWFQP